MHPTPQGVTLDFEEYDKLKGVDKVFPTLLPDCLVNIVQYVFHLLPTNQGETHLYCSLFKSDFFSFCPEIHFSTQMKTGIQIVNEEQR
jgi:hypothetical protein